MYFTISNNLIWYPIHDSIGEQHIQPIFLINADTRCRILPWSPYLLTYLSFNKCHNKKMERQSSSPLSSCSAAMDQSRTWPGTVETMGSQTPVYCVCSLLPGPIITDSLFRPPPWSPSPLSLRLGCVRLCERRDDPRRGMQPTLFFINVLSLSAGARAIPSDSRHECDATPAWNYIFFCAPNGLLIFFWCAINGRGKRVAFSSGLETRICRVWILHAIKLSFFFYPWPLR